MSAVVVSITVAIWSFLLRASKVKGFFPVCRQAGKKKLIQALVRLVANATPSVFDLLLRGKNGGSWPAGKLKVFS